MLNRLMTSRLAIAVAAALTAAVTLPACTVARDQQTVGSYIDDTAITTRIKARFAEDTTVSAMAITVETLQGVVQLAGFAKSADERASAERLARAVPGVAAVRNDIIVRS